MKKSEPIAYYKKQYLSPIGALTLYSTESALVELNFAKLRHPGAPARAGGREDVTPPILEEGCRWLDRYFAGERPDIEELSLEPVGSEFQQAVWSLLRRIPYGETTTYGALAAEIARQKGIPRMSAQAVGGAVGRNPLGIIVPCHRVVGTDSSLVGFGGGLPTKIWLLTHEGVDMSRFTVPTRGTAL